MIESVTAARLGRLTRDQVEAALAHFDLGTVLEVTPAPFINWGQNIFVTTTAGAFVLPGAPSFDDQFYRERYFIQKLAESTAVSVPWPYRINPSPAVFGLSFRDWVRGYLPGPA